MYNLSNKFSLRERFLEWITIYNPDHVSKIVLASLLDKYDKGDKESLFSKYKQLIDVEHYELAAIFKNCLIFVNINDEFITWLK